MKVWFISPMWLRWSSTLEMVTASPMLCTSKMQNSNMELDKVDSAILNLILMCMFVCLIVSLVEFCRVVKEVVVDLRSQQPGGQCKMEVIHKLQYSYAKHVLLKIINL